MKNKNNKKNRKKMKIGSISLLSVILLCMTGCSKNAVSAEPTDSNKTGMGRYVEQTIAAKEEMGRIDGFTKQEDGSLIAFSYNHGVFCSEDEGTTWKKEASWFDAMNGEYLLDVAASAQGEYGYIYIPPENTEEVTESTEKISEDPGEKTEQETEQDVEETSEEDESWVKDQMTLNAHYVYVDKNGQSEELEIQLPESGGENYLNDMVFLEDGTLIGAEADTGTVYAIDKESGKTTELFTADAYINYLTVTNQYILAITRDQIYIYNIQTGRLEDTDQTLRFYLYIGRKFVTIADIRRRFGGYGLCCMQKWIVSPCDWWKYYGTINRWQFEHFRKSIGDLISNLL